MFFLLTVLFHRRDLRTQNTSCHIHHVLTFQRCVSSAPLGCAFSIPGSALLLILRSSIQSRTKETKIRAQHAATTCNQMDQHSFPYLLCWLVKQDDNRRQTRGRRCVTASLFFVFILLRGYTLIQLTIMAIIIFAMATRCLSASLCVREEPKSSELHCFISQVCQK